MARSRKKSKVREVKDKFLEEKEVKVAPLRAMNEKQAEYIKLINTKELILATGYAGTSKTYIPAVMACDALQRGSKRGGVDKVILSRPNISNSRSLGFLPGDLVEKFSYWVGPVLNVFRERLGEDSLRLHLEKKNIEFVPFEVIKGYSASDCFFLIDEAEDIDWAEAKKAVTRQGRNCTMVLSGDLQQSELGASSGLKKLIELSNKHPRLGVGVVDFNEINDIVRSKAAREWARVFELEGL